MARKRRQNKIAESRLALPLAAIYGVLTCLAYGVAEKQLWVQLACLSASTLLMAALNNINALIRLYTLMRALMLFNAAMSRVEADKQASCTHNCFSATP